MQVAHQARINSSQFLKHEATRSNSTPPRWDASHCVGLLPAFSSPLPSYTPGWREVLWQRLGEQQNTIIPLPVSEPGPLDLELRAQTMKPPCLWPSRLHRLKTLLCYKISSRVRLPSLLSILFTYATSCRSEDVVGISNGLCEHLRAVCLFLRARAVIIFALRAAST